MSTQPDGKRMKDRLASLIAFDTQNPPGGEDEAAQFLANEMRDIGFQVALDEIAPDRKNVIGVHTNGPGPTVAFNSHIDVVPAGEGWSRDPFTLWEDGGRLYGRGANDAKGQVICMLEAARMLMDAPQSWSGTLMCVFVAGEEVDSIGARSFVRQKPKIDYAIIGEPTSNRAAPAHKGSMRPIVRVRGQMAHSANPERGVNAIFQAARLLRRIEAEHENVVRLRRHSLAGSASLTVTRVRSGIGDNVIPDSCDVMLDRRMIPGETDESVLEEIQILLNQIRLEDGVEAEIIELRGTTGGPSETPADSPLVQAALASAKTHGVKDAGPTGLSAGCDMVHFRSIGAHGVVIGPGDIAVAHKPDEFVPFEEFVTASLIHRDIVTAVLPRVT